MQQHLSDIKKEVSRQPEPGIDELDDLNNRRRDILPKMSGMINRNATFEISNTACHVCGSRFSMHFKVEVKQQAEDANVFRFNMTCQHCQWNAVFYGYLHKDGRNGLDARQVSVDRFFADPQ